MLGIGSSLIGKSLKTEILREEAMELAIEGFLPFSERGEGPKEEKRSLFRELGPAVRYGPRDDPTPQRFLEPHGKSPTRSYSMAVFSFPEILRERVADVLAHWYGQPSGDF